MTLEAPWELPLVWPGEGKESKRLQYSVPVGFGLALPYWVNIADSYLVRLSNNFKLTGLLSLPSGGAMPSKTQ